MLDSQNDSLTRFVQQGLYKISQALKPHQIGRGSSLLGADLCGSPANPKLGIFRAALWLTFALPLTDGTNTRQVVRDLDGVK